MAISFLALLAMELFTRRSATRRSRADAGVRPHIFRKVLRS